MGILKRSIGAILCLCVLLNVSVVGVFVTPSVSSEAASAYITYNESAPQISGVKFTSTNVTSKMLQQYTSDQGDVVYNPEYEYTYPTYSATFTGANTVSNSSGYVQHLKSGHPRLLTSDFSVYVDRAKTDVTSKLLFDDIMSYANQYIEAEPYEFYMNIRDNINDFSGNIEQRVVTLAMAYNLQKVKVERGDADAVTDYEKYADRAIEELLNAAEYPHWSQDAYLCTAEIAVGFAFGYDWLYDYLQLPKNAEALQIIKDTIYEMAIVPYAYNYSKKKYWGTNNWNEVCNGSGIIVALAFYDANDTTGKYSAVCEYVLESAAHYLHNGLVQYKDNGFFCEGIGYWSYATEYLVRAIAAYQGALRDNFVLPARFQHINVQGVSETVEFPIYMNGVTGTLNFGDCGSSFVFSEVMYWFANYLNKPEYANYLNTFLQMKGKALHNEAAVYSLIWYNPQPIDFSTLSKISPDKAHVSEDDVNILTLRKAFDSEDTFVGMHGGNFKASHNGMSLGSFVLDMTGKRFVQSLGAGNYVWPGYFSVATSDSQRYTYYCMRAEGNNTLIVDPGYSGEQRKEAFVQIIDSGTSADTGYGIMDLTSTSSNFKKHYRGVMVTQDRMRVVVQDEFQATEDANGKGRFNDVYWFAHTGNPEKGGATVEISEDGKTAKLTIGTTSIYAKITKGPGTFEWVDAEPLPTSPNPEIQHARMEGYGKKLRIHMTNIANATLRVEFSPEGMQDENVPFAALADWDTQLTDETLNKADTYLSTGNYETDWYKPSYETYYIHDDKDLSGVAYLVNSGVDFTGKTVKLVNDIAINPELSWSPIGNDDFAFKGVFDGSQKTIQGMRNLDLNRNSGLFGKIQDGTVKNLRIYDSCVEGSTDAGVLAGTVSNTRIYNVFVEDSTVRGNSRIGGIVGAQFGGSIENCGVDAAVYGSKTYYAGIVGYSTGVVENCVAHAKLCEYTQTKTTQTKTIISQNADGALEKVVETTITRVHDTTGEEKISVTVTEPEIITEGEVGETTTTKTVVEGITTGSSIGGVAAFVAFGDVRNSYYLYDTVYVPSGMRPYTTGSILTSNNCGKTGTATEVSPIAGLSSVLTYKGKARYAHEHLNLWIADQENSSEYITWSRTDQPFFGSYSTVLNFEPEVVVDENNNKDIFELSNAAVSDGKVNFVVKNMKNDTLDGYLVVVQTKTDGTKTTNILPLSMGAKGAQNMNVDAQSGASVRIFVLDSFFNMKIKSNILEL